MYTDMARAEKGLVRKAVLDPMIPKPYLLLRVHEETLDTFTLELEPRHGPSMIFAPGQFNMLYSFGMGEVPISISGDPGKPEVLVHTIRAVGAVTRGLCSLEPGAVVGVRGPFGNCWPVGQAEGRDVVLVAGGLGLAPLRPVLYHMLANRSTYGRLVLIYGAKTPQDLLFTGELERLRGRADIDVEMIVDSAAGKWDGHVGVVTTLIPGAGFDPEAAMAFVCGPEIMMHFSVAQLKQRGVSNTNIFISMERNMKCGIGLCGHCQFSAAFVCKDGPVFRHADIEHLLAIREV
jgi:NAD(P)H-flavin reductase